MKDLLSRLEENGYDADEVLERFLDDKEMLIGFIKDFFEDDSYQNLCTAITEKKFDKAFSSAHTLKGISSNLGFKDLANVTGKLVEDLRVGKYDKGKFQLVEFEYNKLKNIVM